MKKITVLMLAVCSLFFTSCSESVTLSSLLDEMTDREQLTRFPEKIYTQKQMSSYDRRSVAKGEPGWFANCDGWGSVRIDTIEGRVETVMFDEVGPGAITRIWMTTVGKQGTMRFYLDGEQQASVVIPAYDMKKFPMEIHEGLSLTHTHYEAELEKVGGNTFYLPIPYQKSCKITFEDPVEKAPRYYQINYRTYEEGTEVETFTLAEAKKLTDKINQVGNHLLNPETDKVEGTITEKDLDLKAGKSEIVGLPSGTKAVRNLTVKVSGFENDSIYAEIMRAVVLEGCFDGVKTIRVPLADFSGAGMGAPKTDGWYLSADGKGMITCRFVMPYQKDATFTLSNTSANDVKVSLSATTSDYQWDNNSMYFHVSHKFEKEIRLDCKPDEGNVLEWNFITLKGKGVYVGDLLSLYNHSPKWYGEGDEKIYIDGEKFPSHFGTGTEDYYNCSWAPVVPFLTPYGGAPRADETTSHGYNTFLRTRNLDVIPFTTELLFDIEMISWLPGTADYYTTVYWYGTTAAHDNANF